MIHMTVADLRAIDLNDSNYINQKGANAYVQEDYAQAVEYYRLGAAMGNVASISNLGYCYLYGRSIEPNISLAIGYFQIAACKRSVDAAYKLGDIYGSEKWGVQDKELSIYYYRMATSYIQEFENISENELVWCNTLQNYPSLCFALGRELSHGGAMMMDIDVAYQYLKHAEMGYQRELYNGHRMYEKAYASVRQLLADAQFDPIREMYDQRFEEYYEEESE